MSSPKAVSSESDEDFHSVTGDIKLAEPQQPDHEDDDEQDETFPPPEHPLKSMQGPFEESILESNLELQRPASRANAELRRQRLLDAARFDESWTTRWKQRQDAQYHPLLKLMAQITFGMHLLQQNQAKNDAEVVKILQNHVDEVDNFLEQTAEDFDLAIRDIDERIRFLQLPMQHAKVFNIMLDDKQFRTQLLDGNEKIERIIDRTARAMNAALLDVQKGRQSTRELSKYLNSVQYTWPTDKADLDAIYNAMRGNEEGWKKCYKDLQARGNHLGNKLIELGTIIGEMSKMAAAASRRVAHVARPSSSGKSSIPNPTILRSRFNPDARAGANITTPAKDKPLPRAPATAAGVERATSKTRPISYHQRFEAPREVPTVQKTRADTTERPKTSSGVRGEAGQPVAGTARKASGPLSSHPPETARPQSAGVDGANGSIKTTNALLNTTRSTSQPALVDTKAPTHARAASAVTPSTKNSRETLSGSSFARRWSIRKKFPGPTPEDYRPPPSLKKHDPAHTSQSSLRSASQQRLATVAEGPDKKPSDHAPKADTTTNTAPDLTALPETRPKANSDSKVQEQTRQSMAPAIHTGPSIASAPSIRSSLKRRTLSIRAIFGRRGRAEIPMND